LSPSRSASERSGSERVATAWVARAIVEALLVAIVSQADLATNIDEQKVGDLVEAISAAP
jgi:hypothetical protein